MEIGLNAIHKISIGECMCEFAHLFNFFICFRSKKIRLIQCAIAS